MTAELKRAEEKYEAKFHDLPTFLLRALSDEEIIKALNTAVRIGKPLEPDSPDDDY